MKRWVAYKMLLKDIHSGNFTEDGFLLIGSKQIIRVNIVATVVSKYISEDGKFGSITLDDGTDTIRVRFFEDTSQIENIEVGDIVRVIGRLRKYEDEVYIVPEIIRVLDDPNYEIINKLEAIKHRVIVSKPEEIVEEEIEIITSPKEDVIKAIKELDMGEGVEIKQIAEALNIEEKVIEDIVAELMADGDVYEPKPGKVKLLE